MLIAALTLALSAPDEARMTEIYQAMHERIGTQTDVWFDEGDFPKSIELLKTKVVMWPNDYESATDLGWMQENVREWADARETYRRYREANPGDPDRALPEGQFLFNRARFDKKPELYTEAIALVEPTLSEKAHPNTWRTVALAYERTKKYDSAVATWDRYLKVHPEDLAAKASRQRAVDKSKKP